MLFSAAIVHRTPLSDEQFACYEILRGIHGKSPALVRAVLSRYDVRGFKGIPWSLLETNGFPGVDRLVQAQHSAGAICEPAQFSRTFWLAFTYDLMRGARQT